MCGIEVIPAITNRQHRKCRFPRNCTWSGSGQNHFGICIPDLQKGTAFALESVRRCNIVAYLNIDFFVTLLYNEVDFFLVQLSDIHIIPTAQKFNADHVFIHPAVIHISASQNGITDTCITQIKLYRAFQLFSTPDVIALNVVKDKGIAQISDILSNCYMISLSVTGCQ